MRMQRAQLVGSRCHLSLRCFARPLSLPVTLCALLGGSPANAIDPHLDLSQLGHSEWRVQDGLLPGSPTVITQTKDGYVWIGTQTGLVRFDGISFNRVPLPGDQASPQITSLYVASDDSLWIGTGSHLLRRKDGRTHLYSWPIGLFAAVREAPNGTIWATRYHTHDDAGSLCEVRADHVTCFGRKQGLFSDAGPLAIAASGTMWVATANRLARWRDGRSTIFAPAALAGDAGLEGYKSVTIAPDGTLWTGVVNAGPGLGLEHLVHDTWLSVTNGKLDSSMWEVTALLFDRDGTLWVGTADSGLYRITESRIDHFGVGDGLTANSVSGLFEDREGDIWVATTDGIDLLRELPVTTFSSRQGLSADDAEAVAISGNGKIWVSNGAALDEVGDHTSRTYTRLDGLPGNNPTALFDDSLGRIWVGVDDGVAVLDHGHFKRVQSAGGPIGPIYEFSAGADGTVWAITATLPSRLIRMSETRVLESISPPEGSRFAPLAASPDGSLWLGSENAQDSYDLIHYANGQWHKYSLHNPPDSGVFGEIVAQSLQSIFVASIGIIEWHSGIWHRLSVANGLPCDHIYTLIFDRDGDLWAYGQCGLVKITARQLSEWWKNPAVRLHIRHLAVSDGVLASNADFHPRAAVAPDGTIWFANSRELQFVNPRHMRYDAVAPPVHIQALRADGRSYPLRPELTLPPLTRNVEIDYTGLSFVIPHRVQFRYRLEGWNPQWQDPGNRRQAFFTNLPPGAYRFSVIASNADGVWNTAGDSVEFRLKPAYYQTWWFRLLCLAAVLALIGLAYVYNLHLAKKRLRQRLLSRLEERERIARELHDTLLQGFQGLLLRFHVAATSIPSDTSARVDVDEILAQGRAVIEEGRARVRDLRGSERSSTELARQLTSHAAGYSQSHAATFSVEVAGNAALLNPVAADEALAIGREAITNAFTHADAGHLDVEVICDDKGLTLRVRDDGKGMDQETAEGGRAGHWGIMGMRERARNVAAKLTISSRPASGTEVEFTVPPGTAYAPRQRDKGGE
jgi:signal transduction histidine kinase/ligand-binding sensor domain-containing protein